MAPGVGGGLAFRKPGERRAALAARDEDRARRRAAPDEDGDVALVPLATPLVAGPGAIATVIVLARRHPEGAVVAGTLVALVVLGACLLLAERLARLVSPSLLHFLTLVFGLLLAAIAVQLVVEGVRPLVEGG